MKYNQVPFLLLFGILAILFQSCEKIGPDISVTSSSYSLKFSRKALDYVKLTEKKYLIYKDSASGHLDSVVVTKSSLENKYTPEEWYWYGWYSAYYHENFSLTLTKFTGGVGSEWFNGEAKLLISDPAYSTDIAPINLVTLDKFANSYTTFYLGEDDPTNYSMIIEGKTYNNVVTTVYDRNLDINHPDYLKETYYWAKGIGIIKRELITTGGAVKTARLLRNN